MNGQAMPTCSICTDLLGKYGGPVTLPCGHNGCRCCFEQLQRAKPECPLCRCPFPAAVPLVVNRELRDLVALAAALGTVEQSDGWQAITSQVMAIEGGEEGEESGLHLRVTQLLHSVVQKPEAVAFALQVAATAGGEEGKEGGVSLVPSAPPAHMSLSSVLDGQGDMLSLEPPSWVPDSHARACSRCRAAFRALVRGRHHCRLCGGIFCASCSATRQLLPPKFREAAPQRVCTSCAALLLPLQPFLAGTISQAVQPAVHDVTDASALRSWLNPPLGASLAAELYKATNIVRGFAKLGTLAPERSIPAAVLDGAAGFAILSVAKGGCGWSVSAGTGLVLARRGAGWSPPSAIALYGLGWGLQLGGSLCDLLIVLRNQAAVSAFCGAVHCGVAGALDLAVGPIGRQAEVAMQVGSWGAALCYSYSCSRGAFAGVSVNGSLLTTRNDVNLNFYGRPLSARQLLLGENVGAPVAADALYTALDDLMARVGVLTAERRERLAAAAVAGPGAGRECSRHGSRAASTHACSTLSAGSASRPATWMDPDQQTQRRDQGGGHQPAHAEAVPEEAEEEHLDFGGLFE